MPTVPTAISRIVSTSADLRPRTSPIRPSTRPPKGRARNPTPKAAKVARSEATSSVPGKNLRAITLAKKPYTPKS